MKPARGLGDAALKKVDALRKQAQEESKEVTWLPELLDETQNSLVSQVGNAIHWEPELAMAFCVAILQDVNYHEEAASLNSQFLNGMSKE